MKLLLIWHMHQPTYKDYASGSYQLPWIYLHTTKDYYEMPYLASQFDRIKVTFNLTACLIEAIRDYAENDPTDRWLRLLRTPPELMSEEEAQFARDNFFMVDTERFIDAHPRYKELFLQRQRQQKFSTADLRDLQVLFQLAWLGESSRRHQPAIERLVKKRRGYDQQDQQTLQDRTSFILKTTLSLYQELWEAGKAELSTTPYAHPILPLLCDMQVAKRSAPHTPFPESNFAHPEDARQHTRLAVEYFRETFGRAPDGFWPAEGAVSHDALAILAEHGGRWAASDEEILRRCRIRSVAGDSDVGVDVHRPYRYQVGNKDITLFFRDHTLSDLFGFVYQRWNEEEAVEDFIKRLRAIQETKPDALVSVILDGENAWEHYSANGYDFLRLLYERLDGTDWIETSTPSACLPDAAQQGHLRSLHPGSWIDANFNTWIGDEEKNRAWHYLKRAREAISRQQASGNGSGKKPPTDQTAESLERASQLTQRSLLAAEGSDWFWWFGQTHSSAQDPLFDRLFRTHVKNIYLGLGLSWPAYLDTPVSSHQGKLQRAPVAFMTPRINGRDSSYFEWLPAGLLSLQSQGAMHRKESRLSKLYFGFDQENLYLRIDFDRPARETLASGSLKIDLHSLCQDVRIDVRSEQRDPDVACQEIVEVKVPFQALELSFEQSFDIVLILTDSDQQETERFPQSGSVRLTVPPEDLEVENWMV